MISVVAPPRPIPQPQLPPTVSQVVRNPIKERAAVGYFRDLALWLNEPLVNQGIFVQVQADDRPGCLKLTVEFERSPIQDRLTRFLCHRIWQLNSELIEGIYVLARPVGWQRVLWKQRIKISTPALRRRKAQEQLTQAARTPGSAIPYAQGTPRKRRRARRRTPSVFLTGQRFKALRTLMLTGSAVAAFVLGCLLEVALSGPSPSLSTFSAQATLSETRLEEKNTSGLSPQFSASQGLAPEIPTTDGTMDPVGRTTSTVAAPAAFPRPPQSTNAGPRPLVVNTALEPVAVISHTKPSPVPLDQVTLAFGGDISLEDLNFAQIEEEGGFFADVEDYFQADVSLVNLATPLATAATSLDEEFRHQLRPEAAQMLANSGVDIVNLTHSSLMQYGTEGLTETLTALDSNGLYRVGAGRNAIEARRPEILDVKGKRIAYLSYAMGGNNAAMDTSALRERAGANNTNNEVVARELENFKRSTAFQDRSGFNAQNMPEIVQDIQAIRDQVDWIVVNFRWVDHLEETPNFVQTNLARLAIDQGADLVVGYHPTVIQGGEIYKGRPIAYSLGDFVFKPDQPLADQDSAMLKVALHEDQMQVEFVPVRIRDSRPHTLGGEAGHALLGRIQRASSQFDTPLQPSVVLDLKAPAVSAPESLDPNSPFVTPEAEDTLMLDAPASEAATPDAKADTPSDPAAEDSPAVAPDTLEMPMPEGVPNLDLQQIHQNLQEWGPKLSPKDQEFQPVPQNRSGAAESTLEAQAHPDLLQRFADSLRAPNSETGGSWNDTVPAVPTAPPEATPKADEADPTAAPAPAVAEPAPSRPEARKSEESGGKVETPNDATPTELDKEVAPEAAFPDTKVIPPQAEPLVGPLT